MVKVIDDPAAPPPVPPVVTRITIEYTDGSVEGSEVDAVTLYKVKVAAAVLRVSPAAYVVVALREAAERDIAREVGTLSGNEGG